LKITISAQSDLTGFDRRTISRRLADLKCEDKGKGGKFYQSDHALSTLYGGGGENLDPAQERALLDNARRRLAELEFSKRRGELLSADVAYRAIEQCATAFKSRLQNFPGQISSILAAESDAKKIEKLLDQEIWNALDEITRTDVTR
jgi:hypothetical protein